jgi:hypothetical protein
MKPKIKNINEKIDFGLLEGQTFQQIFRFSYSYLEWIIRDTEICFQDLDEFYVFGKPIDPMKLNEMIKESLLDHVIKNNKQSKNGGRLIHFDNYVQLKKMGILSFSDFIELNYKFPADIIEINNKKLSILETNIINN